MRSPFDPAAGRPAGPVANLLIAIVLSIPIKLALVGGFVRPRLAALAGAASGLLSQRRARVISLVPIHR